VPERRRGESVWEFVAGEPGDRRPWGLYLIGLAGFSALITGLVWLLLIAAQSWRGQ
jgi:hypothetical protein